MTCSDGIGVLWAAEARILILRPLGCSTRGWHPTSQGGMEVGCVCRGTVSSGPISSEWAYDSLGRAAAQTWWQASTGCLGMPAYFVQSHGTTIWERRVSSWPALMTNDFSGLRFGVCRGYFKSGGLRPISPLCWGSAFRGRSGFVLEHAVAARLLQQQRMCDARRRVGFW